MASRSSQTATLNCQGSLVENKLFVKHCNAFDVIKLKTTEYIYNIFFCMYLQILMLQSQGTKSKT